MRVLVTGGYGLIGSAVLARLQREGHALIGAGRDLRTARRRFPYCRWIAADFRRLTQPEDWTPLLAGIDAVVNCVGVLQDGIRDDVRRVQADATIALFAACEAAGVRRVVHVSAIGAEEGAPSDFARSKAAAENDLAHRDLDWAILRPGLVLAPAAYGGTALLRAVAAFPFITPLVVGEARVQIVGIDDLIETVAFLLREDTPAKVRWDVAHPEVYRLRDIVVAMRGWLGFPSRPAVPLPRWKTSAISRCADALGWLGWRSPARSTALAQLSAGVVGYPAGWMAATGIEPTSLAETLARHPAGIQDRWFARLYLLKPIAIGGLALFWIATGLLALGPGWDAALGYLEVAGFKPGLAETTLVVGSLFDIAVGLLLLWRKAARGTLVVMLLATIGYLIVGTIAAPGLWLDPLGPFTKIVPMLLATLFALAIIDER
jgi:uncharacterized protein YbjT (DUF2867 family)